MKGGYRIMAAIRKHVTLAKAIVEWYTAKSEEIGISCSSLMAIALKEYMDKTDKENKMQWKKIGI